MLLTCTLLFLHSVFSSVNYPPSYRKPDEPIDERAFRKWVSTNQTALDGSLPKKDSQLLRIAYWNLENHRANNLNSEKLPVLVKVILNIDADIVFINNLQGNKGYIKDFKDAGYSDIIIDNLDGEKKMDVVLIRSPKLSSSVSKEHNLEHYFTMARFSPDTDKSIPSFTILHANLSPKSENNRSRDISSIRDSLSQDLSRNDDPIVFVGTLFEETPLTSSALNPITEMIKFKDSFTSAPSITSWRGLRDDHILVSDFVEVKGAYTPSSHNFSLHLPVVVDLTIKPGQITVNIPISIKASWTTVTKSGASKMTEVISFGFLSALFFITMVFF